MIEGSTSKNTDEPTENSNVYHQSSFSPGEVSVLWLSFSSSSWSKQATKIWLGYPCTQLTGNKQEWQLNIR